MNGTITISAYSGGTFSVGNTITGVTSGASGVVTYVGNNFVRFATITSGPFLNSESISNGSGVSATTLATSAQITSYAFLIDGTESPVLNLETHNTYKFLRSDSSNVARSLTFSGTNPTDFTINLVGGDGQPGAYTEFIIKPTAPISTSTVRYGSATTGSYLNVADGSATPGVYGSGASANITVSDGLVTGFT